MKKGAMFGLDARIALAIFGALSVISGAALYSAIQEAKLEQYWQYFVEHDKATEQYYLDNGKPIPQYTKNVLYTPDLVVNRENLSTWKGPYIDYTMASISTIIDQTSKGIDNAGVFQLWAAPSSTWASIASHNDCILNSSDCSMFLAFYGGSTAGKAKLLDLFNKLDAKIDNSDGKASGKIRFHESNFGYLMYQGMNYKRIL